MRPVPDRDSAAWWEAVRRHELTVQVCDDCGTPRFPARAVCHRCRSFAWSWRPAAGTGRVVSWVVTHQVFAPAFAGAVPYTVVLVRLDDAEDCLMHGGFTGTPSADLPVRARFDDVGDDLTLVNWVPA
ncbi:hypothetical protein D5H75_26860 [Bailinhaonella thermotolerans]|uniref:DNA-binding protein n=2 Tax=Bailinhaonella thermotolerans TaxID=1070861 RepID=A0A3A4AYB5_9ACTN|nr:hypothetical protein D5H75_26860 [Bailinhaonella thermotolerans]